MYIRIAKSALALAMLSEVLRNITIALFELDLKNYLISIVHHSTRYLPIRRSALMHLQRTDILTLH